MVSSNKVWIDEQMDGWMNMDGWMDEWVDEWVGGWMGR